ncbi:ADP-sugar pyrophosphatase-like isoform X2 [Saccoglossus kowalevskii]
MTDNYPNNEELGEKRRKCEFIKQEMLCTGNWLSLHKTTYQDPMGREQTWETVERTTRRENYKTDAVCIVAILKRLLHYDCIVLVKQYRPPMKCYTVEFPAGLLDPNESIEDTAKRELKEETGYTGKVRHSGLAQITIHIDGDDPINKKPTQRTEDGEFIEVLHVPVYDLLKKLQVLSKEDDIVIDSRVYAYALGLSQSYELLHCKKI